MAAIREHPWFSDIDWGLLADKKLHPPFVPVLNGDHDIAHFAKEFTCCSLESNSSSYNDSKKYEGFSFEGSLSPHSAKGDMEEEKMEAEEEGEGEGGEGETEMKGEGGIEMKV